MGRSRYAKPPYRFIDMGNPLFNLMIDIFFMIALVAVLRLIALEVYHYVRTGRVSRQKTKVLKKICSEGVYWGTVASLYIGMAYTTKKIFGIGDWKKAMVAGALTGAIVSAAGRNNKDKIVTDAITGCSIASAVKELASFASGPTAREFTYVHGSVYADCVRRSLKLSYRSGPPTIAPVSSLGFGVFGWNHLLKLMGQLISSLADDFGTDAPL